MSLSSFLKIACSAGCKAVGANFGNQEGHVEDRLVDWCYDFSKHRNLKPVTHTLFYSVSRLSEYSVSTYKSQV